jgi:prepilin-type N-terminal cleavage/methylation domain-containing protein
MRIEKSNNKGLSLVELVIVVAIIAILAAAISPALIRYIEKARKRVDVQSAQMVYDAVTFSLSSGDDELLDSWMNIDNGEAAAEFTDPYYGHKMRPVAWARGVKVGEYENSLFKCAHNGQNEQKFVNDMLEALAQDKAKGLGNSWSSDKKKPNAYDGQSVCMVPLKYGKKMKSDFSNESDYPEAYIICRDTVTNDPVIYIGTKHSGQNLKAFWRVYPDTCDKYK